MFSETVIKVSNVSKCYQIYDKPRDRLLQMLTRGLKKYFKEFWALQDITFEIKKGETIGIVGRNGSGKSTLLQIICGTLSPSSGHIETQGRIAALLELGSGFNPEFSGRENVYLNASILGLKEKEIDERYDAIAAFADIGTFIDQPIKTYSSGMVVRLAFATAIHVEPDILVVDEALAVGDTAFQQKCLNRIRQMQREGVSILLVTHSTNTLVEYCDRGIYFKKGRLMLDGPCREVVKVYANDLVEAEGGITLEKESNSEHSEKHGHFGETDTKVSFGEKRDSPNQKHFAMRVDSVKMVDETGSVCGAVRFSQRISVVVNVEVNKMIVEPCFGIQISSPDGITLWSATTQSLNIDMASMSSGNYQFTWDLTANFSGNRYIVAIGVGEIMNGEYKRHHRLDYAGHFDVVPTAHSGVGWLAPLPKFDLQAHNKEVIGGEIE